MSGDEDGWCGGYTVHMDEGQASAVLGPDGEPVKFVKRHVAGFDLRLKQRRSAAAPHSSPHSATKNADRATPPKTHNRTQRAIERAGQ